MELCDETLSDFIANRQAGIEALLKDDLFTTENMVSYLKIYLSIIRAVEHIHNEGRIIHRDIKPANIFITNGEVRIGDFGLSTHESDNKYIKYGRRMSFDSDLGYHTKNIGTTLYAADEQLNSHYYDYKV